MASSLDTMLQSLIQQDLQQRASDKKVKVQQASALKRSVLDPNFSVFDPDNYIVTDADTLYDLTTGESLRLTAGQNRMADAFETDVKRYSQNPDRANAHREAYAALYGRDKNDISNEDLVNAGLAQKQMMTERLQALRGQGMGLTRTGKDEYGRTLAQFDSPDVLHPISSSEGNAGYFSKYNYEGMRDDVKSGKDKELYKPERSYTEALTQDAATSLAVGTVRMVSGMA